MRSLNRSYWKRLLPVLLIMFFLISMVLIGASSSSLERSLGESMVDPMNSPPKTSTEPAHTTSEQHSALYQSHPTTHTITDITVTNPENAYDNNEATYASFKYTQIDGSFELNSFTTLSDPWRIVQVDFNMKYSTTISSSDDKYRILYYADPSTTPDILEDWKRKTVSLNIYKWPNRLEPNDGVWDWTDISNIRFVIETDRVGGADSGGDFEAYEIWVTVTYRSPTVHVEPASIETTDPFSVIINITNMDYLYSWEFKVAYNTAVLTVTDATEGAFLSSGGSTYFNKTINDSEGWVYAYCTLLEDVPGVTGNGTLATISFSPDAGGESVLDLHDTKLGEYDYVSKKTYLYPPYYVEEVDGYANVPLVAPDFSISASPTSLTIEQGSSDTSTITIVSLNAFSSAVDLTVSGVPPDVTATLDPTEVTPPSDGSDTSILTVQVGATATPDTYTLTVTGTSGELEHSVDISLEITELLPPPDFSISASPDSLTIIQGGSDTSTITVTSLYGFSNLVVLMVSGEPADVTATLDPTMVTPPADGQETSTLTVVVGATALVDTYTLTVIGTSGMLQHTAEIELNITPLPDFSISASPTSLTIEQGSSDTSTVTVTSLDGFSSAVDLTVSGVPSDVTATLDPTGVTPPSDGSDTSILTVQVGATATPDTYTLTVTGTSGDLSHSVDITLEITPLAPLPDFSISASPATLTIAQGDSDTSTITLTSLNGFSESVDLTVFGVPADVTATLDPTMVTPPADGQETSLLTVEVDISASPNTYTLTVTGTSGELEHSVDIELTIIAAPDFSISASPTSLTIELDGFDTSTITIDSLNGFNQLVDLTVSGVPPDVTATLDPTGVTPPSDGSDTSILTVQVGATATPDTYTLTVTGTSGDLSHSVDITLEIVTSLGPIIYVDPQEIVRLPGETFTVDIKISGVSPDQGVNGWELMIKFDFALLYTESGWITQGDFLKSVGMTMFTKTKKSAQSAWLIGCALMTSAEASGSGTLATIQFEVAGTGETPLDLMNTDLRDSSLMPIEHTAEDGFFMTPIPKASFTYNYTGKDEGYSPIVGQVITFNASDSYDPDGWIVSYTWDFGDGNVTTVLNTTDTDYWLINHTYPEAGVYVVELNVTDNDGYIGSVTGSVAVELHDLEITTVEVNPTIIRPGEEPFPSIEITVFNNGSVGEFFNLTCYYDNTPIWYNETLGWKAYMLYRYDEEGNPQDPLSLDQSITITFTWNTTGVSEGTYNIRANVTRMHSSGTYYLPGETDLADNEFTVEVIVTIGTPVADFTYTPDDPIVDETVTFDSSASYDLDGWIASFTWDFGDETPILNVDNTTTIVTHAYAIAGTFEVTLNVTDNDGVIGTKIRYVTVSAVEVHDIAIIGVSASPTTVIIGQTVSITVVAENQGTETETFDVTVYYDDVVIGTQTITDLAADDSETLSFSWNTAGMIEGDYTIKAVADILPEETDTADNTYVDGTVTLTAVHDIAIIDVSASPTTVNIGEPVSIDVTIQNLGDFDETFDVNVYYDSTLIEERTDVDLAAGLTTTITFTWVTTEGGTFTIKAEVPPVPGETDTDNNVYVDGTVVVTAFVHDIAIIDVSASPTTVIIGQTVSITVVAENQGTETETFNVTVYYDDEVIETQTIIDLAASDSETLSFSWNTAGMTEGDYTIKAVADILPEETDTADNTYVDGTVTLTTAPSELIVTVDINPETLNLRSKGNWITCYLQLPEGYSVEEIDVSTILLGGTIPAERADVLNSVLMVKFDRAAVIEYIRNVLDMTEDRVTLTITGNLLDGTPFEGSDTIRVLSKK